MTSYLRPPRAVVIAAHLDEELKEWTAEVTFTRGYHEFSFPPPPPPARQQATADVTRSLREFRALVELFYSCGGPFVKAEGGVGWARQDGWDRSKIARLPAGQRRHFEAVDSWEGVCVTLGRVSHLSLRSNRLSGEVPSSCWNNLSHCLELNLANNDLQGQIPSSISSLRALEFLDLSENKLSGNIPRQLGELPRFKVLNLANNLLVGMLPSTLNRLVNLRELQIQHNRLDGNIPESMAGGLRYCGYLKLVDISANPRLLGAAGFQEDLRRFLPSCAIFVGSPKITLQTAVQSYDDTAAAGERPTTPQQLEPLDEGQWEGSFEPPWYWHAALA